MTEKEKHEYFGFDRFLQVVGTKYEKELLNLEEKYHNEIIDDQEFNELWDNLIEIILKENNNIGNSDGSK